MADICRQKTSSYYSCHSIFEGDELIGISLGRFLHCTSGTQYSIDEFCIRTDRQREGFGTYFLDKIEEDLEKTDAICIFLQTKRDFPAYEFYLKNYFDEIDGAVSLARFVL